MVHRPRSLGVNGHPGLDRPLTCDHASPILNAMTDIVDRNGVRYEVGCRAEAVEAPGLWLEVTSVDGMGPRFQNRAEGLGNRFADVASGRLWEIVRLADGTDPRDRPDVASIRAMAERQEEKLSRQEEAYRRFVGGVAEKVTEACGSRPVAELYAEFRETVARVAKREIPALDVKRDVVTDFSAWNGQGTCFCAWVSFKGETEEVLVGQDKLSSTEMRTEEACHAIADRLSRKMLGNE